MLLDHPLAWLLITLLVYQIADSLFQKSGRLPILNPAIVSVTTIIILLLIFDAPYQEYKAGTEILFWLMGPTIVSFAVLLYKHLPRVKALLSVISLTILIAGSGIILSAMAMAMIAKLPNDMLFALMTKSITAPIAMEINTLVGGDQAMAVLGVFSTGLPGVVIVPFLLNKLRVTDEAAQGLMLGITAHAFGIARAISISPQAAAFATIGMGLMGCFAALVVPLMLSVLIP